MRNLRALVIMSALLLCTPPLLAQSSAKVGAFLYFEAEDALTDGDRSYIFTLGENTSDDLSLAWKCYEDGLNVVLTVSYMVGDADDEVQVRYRFDQDSPSDVMWWELSNTNKLVYAPMDFVPFFTAQAKMANRVVLRVIDPADGETKQDVFSLSGLRTALQRLPCAR